MSKWRPKEKRRGGARDESVVYVNCTRQGLMELLRETARKCEMIHQHEEQKALPPALRTRI